MTIVLVSCVAAKRSEPAAARDLYLSTWFIKARRYAERCGDTWYVLSANHGLLMPTQTIVPYEMTLNTMSRPQRTAWADRVVQQIAQAVPTANPVVILAGGRYREYLMPMLEALGYNVSVPMQGLGIGQQLQWLERNTP